VCVWVCVCVCMRACVYVCIYNRSRGNLFTNLTKFEYNYSDQVYITVT